MSDYRALVIAKPGSIALEEGEPLTPGYGEVIARPAFVGVCGTDLELLDGVVDPAYVRYPLVPGHEWTGVITEVGAGVAGLSPGQAVISEGIIPDRVCAQCVRGDTNLCAVYDEIGFTRAGAAADQLLLPAQVVHPLAAGVDLAEAALAEPASVAWRGISRVRPRPGMRIVVIGDGTVGLIAAHLLRLFSPAELVVVGMRPDQAELAAALGATAFSLAGSDGLEGRFDLVVEAAGTPAAVQSAFRLARRGGRVLLLGLAGNGVTAALPIDDVVNNDLVITASFGYTSGAWAEVTGLLGSGQLRMGALITHRFPLDAYADAYATLRHAAGPRGKVLIEVSAP